MSKLNRRRRYDKEFKDQAVRLVLEGDKTSQQLAKELGIHCSVLTRWKREQLEQLDENNPERSASKLE